MLSTGLSTAPDEPAEDSHEPPPIPTGWPLEANLQAPDLPALSDPPPTTPTPTPPPPLKSPTPPRRPEVEYADQAAMLRGHTRGPVPQPLVSMAEFKLFALALGVAVMMVGCGLGGVISLWGVASQLLFS